MRAEQLSLTAPNEADGGPASTAAVLPPPPPVTPEQRRAIDSQKRDTLLEAGAGTGKTRVLVERYCDAAEEVGIEAILAFTFTERAAAELRDRIRGELQRRAAAASESGDAGRGALLRELARESERAWISTIHGFCRRLLASHPVALGLDPRFRVLDEGEAERVAIRAFDDALEAFLADGGLERARLIAALQYPALRELVTTAHDELRSEGRDIALPEPAPPDVAAAIAGLAAAARTAEEETAGGPGGRPNLDRIARAAALDTAAAIPSEAEIAELELSGSARAFQGPACRAYREAWKAARRALVEREAVAAYLHLGELVRLYADHYRELKDDRSGLDFEDLQLESRRLLRESDPIAAQYRERLRHLMVDEFQDTNQLQLDLIELLRGSETELFCVGDEFQSIYGFRHADLEVFRGERRRLRELPTEEAAVLPLSGNFRAAPELIAAVNAIGRAILEGFERLTVGSEREPSDDVPVELLLTPSGAEWKEPSLGIEMRGDYPSPPDRVAEARFLAARLRRLVDRGTRPGDIVVLLRAFTHIGAFEEELDRAGLRPYVVGGRGYWSQQQVDDVRRMLSVIANPLDDESLFGLLASPACAVLPDTLWLLRRAARKPDDRREHIWPTLERAFGGGDEEIEEERRRWLAGIPEDDAERLGWLCERLAALRAEAPLLALDQLAERAVTALGYDLAVLGMDRGAKRYANARKLIRMAGDYERSEGRDLRGFLDFLAERAGSDREGEAATEAEDHDGVRVMTVHAAKGLEFPVVAVGDLGRGLVGGGRPAAAIVGAAEAAENGDEGGAEASVPRVGIRLARFGTKAVGVFGYDELLERAREDEAAEACRLAYVAATRAQHRLLLSGRYSTANFAKPAEDGVNESTPVSERLMRALEVVDGTDAEIPLPAAEPREGLDAPSVPGRVAVRFNRPDPDAFKALAPAPPAAVPSAGESLEAPPLARPAASAQAAARHLSYSALAAYGRCGYRFFAERVLGLTGPDGRPLEATAESPVAAGRFGFGNAVHSLLEWSARRGWRLPPPELCRELLRREQLEGDPEQAARAGAMVEGWLASDLGRRLAAPDVSARAEMPFILGLGEAVVRGTMDLLADDGSGPLVVDYKTDSLADRTLDELVDRYGVQRDVYALAAAGDAERVRTAYVFLERPDEPVELELDAEGLAAARERLEVMVEGIREGRFEVTSEPHAALCWDCPARATLCSHPPELTGRRLAP